MLIFDIGRKTGCPAVDRNFGDDKTGKGVSEVMNNLQLKVGGGVFIHHAMA